MYSFRYARLWLVAIFLPALYNGMVGLQIPILNSSKAAIEPFVSGSEPNPNPLKWSSLVMLYHLGIVIGGIFSAHYSDKCGRKPSLMYISNIINVIGSGLCLLAVEINASWALYCGRLTLGIGGGFAMAILPVYILECCPRELRGLIGGILDTWMTVGNLLSGIIARSDVLGSPTNWSWLVTIGAWPSVIGLLVSPLLVETPVFLLNNRGNRDQALKSWSYFNGIIGDSEEAKEQALLEMTETDNQSTDTKISWREAWRNHRSTLVTGSMIGICSAMTGTPVLISYSTALFTSSGVSQLTAQTVTNFMGGSEVAGGLLATGLNHKISRRQIFLPMVITCAVANIILWLVLFLNNYVDSDWFLIFGITSVTLILVVATNVGPSGLGPVLCVELTNPVTRAKTRTLAVAVGVSFRVVLDLIAWPIYDVAGPVLFIVFSLTMVAAFFYFRHILPDDASPSADRLDFMSQISDFSTSRQIQV